MAGVQLQYDENGAVRYFVDVPSGNVDYDGNAIYQRVEVPASSVKSETVNVPYGEDGGGSYQQYTVSSDVYQKAVEAVTPPPVPKDYTRPQEVSQSAVFQDVNPFSFGQLEKIYDSINSGAYKVSPDKSQLITPYGNFGLRPLGNNLYDIPIGARSGSYNVAIGITDDNKAIFNKDFIDNGAVRYQGGAPGGALSSFIQDIGPVGNLALAVATGGLSIPEQIAAQTLYNAAGGQDLGTALKGGLLTTGLAQGAQALSGGASVAVNPDAAFLAADAAQLAGQGLSEAAIAQNLSQYGSTAAANLAASMASNGLAESQIAKSLTDLSANTGLTLQNYTDADMIAQDAMNLKGAVGNDFAAIEQNLVASGVDPLVAADVSQQIAFNPNLTVDQLSTQLSRTYGANIYDTSMLAPTSVLPGEGGYISDIDAGAAAGAVGGAGAAAGAAGAAAGAAGGLGAKDILTALVGSGLLTGGLGALTGGGGGGGGVSLPVASDLSGTSTGMSQFSPDYYQRIQQYYNAYMPEQPRDVATPLADWYNSSFGNYKSSNTPVGAGLMGAAMPVSSIMAPVGQTQSFPNQVSNTQVNPQAPSVFASMPAQDIQNILSLLGNRAA